MQPDIDYGAFQVFLGISIILIIGLAMIELEFWWEHRRRCDARRRAEEELDKQRGESLILEAQKGTAPGAIGSSEGQSRS